MGALSQQLLRRLTLNHAITPDPLTELQAGVLTTLIRVWNITPSGLPRQR